MPLYEYECESCGNRFERIQKFSDPLVEICPTCGGKVRKLISSPAFQFKGSGFYITDYPKQSEASSRGEKGSEKSTGKSADKGGDASSEKGAASASKDSGATSSSSESKSPGSTESSGKAADGGSSSPKPSPKKD